MSDENMNMNPDPTNRLSLNDSAAWDYNPKADGAIAIPVRIGASTDAPSQPADNDEAMIREYEERYYGRRAHENAYFGEMPEAPRKRKRDWDWSSMRNFKLPPSHRYASNPGPTYVEDNERLWAALAHGSALITLIALFSTGPGVVFALLLPLAIYLIFRRRSEFVAYHALQAFTIQTVGTIGAFTLLLVGSMVLTILIIVAAIFSVILIGIPFLIVFVLMFVILVAGTLLAPFAMLIYSMIAAHAAWSGRNYRYPYIADWVDDQLTNGKLNARFI